MLVLPMHVFVQQQPMLCQEVFDLQQHVLHLYCLSARACAAPGCVFFSIFKDFCATPGVSVYKSFALHLDVSADRSFVLYLDVPVCKNFCCACACLSTRAL